VFHDLRRANATGMVAEEVDLKTAETAQTAQTRDGRAMAGSGTRIRGLRRDP
jgi:hypothetical protein